MHNRITALGLSVKVWTSLPCRRPPSVRDLEGKQQNPPSIHVIPEVCLQAHDHYHLGDPLEGAGAVLACTMKEMKLLSVLFDQLDRLLILDTGRAHLVKVTRDFRETTKNTG